MSAVSGTDPSGREAATAWRRVLLVVFAGVAAAMHVGKAPPALAEIRSDLGIGLVAAGWVVSLTALVGAVLGAGIGALTDRVGPRGAFLAGLGLLTCGSLAGAAALAPLQLFVSRAVEGCGLILVLVSAPGLIVYATQPADRRMAFALWGAWMPLGLGTMMLLSVPLLHVFGWRAGWLAAAALTALSGLLLAVAFPRGAGRAGAARGRVLPRLALAAGRRGPWLLAVSFFFYSMSFITVFGFLPTFLIEGQGLSAAEAVPLTALAVYGNAAGNVAAGGLLRRGWPRWALMALACCAMGAASFGIFAASMPGLVRYALCLVFAVVGGLLPATVLGAAAAFAPRPDLVGTVNGMIVQGINCGQLVGPPALALIVSTAGGWSSAPLLLAGAALAGLAAAFGIRRVERRAAALR
ncbi:MFS transporter [Arenibaculum pallidiluteum]|uniref:MFS transporter n=1 Tax=Arenibaculum pallidiluteum TaxID=2812559 RepID=UPI001A95765D|nr:MFS transporter [Arenibaculum pallidiluteum]